MPTPHLARGYTDPAEYVRDLLTVAFPHDYPDETSLAEDVAEVLAANGGIPALQREVADAPHACIPDWMRDRLRELAA